MILGRRSSTAEGARSVAKPSRRNPSGFWDGVDVKPRLKGERGPGLSLKVSEKGGVSVYGLGRFPVTLYKEQWRKLLDMADEIRRFIEENDPRLKSEGE